MTSSIYIYLQHIFYVMKTNLYCIKYINKFNIKKYKILF